MSVVMDRDKRGREGLRYYDSIARFHKAAFKCLLISSTAFVFRQGTIHSISRIGNSVCSHAAYTHIATTPGFRSGKFLEYTRKVEGILIRQGIGICIDSPLDDPGRYSHHTVV